MLLVLLVPGRRLGVDIVEEEPVADAQDLGDVARPVLLADRDHEPIMSRPSRSRCRRGPLASGERHLDELASADRRGQRLVERRPGRDALILPAVGEREVLEAHGVRRVQHAVHASAPATPATSSPSKIVPPPSLPTIDLDARLVLIRRKQQRPDVVQQGEVAEQHAA